VWVRGQAGDWVQHGWQQLLNGIKAVGVKNLRISDNFGQETVEVRGFHVPNFDSGSHSVSMWCDME